MKITHGEILNQEDYLWIGTVQYLSAIRSLLFTTCPDAVEDLRRPHVPFVRCDKGC